MNFKRRKMTETDKLIYTLSILINVSKDEERQEKLKDIQERLLIKIGKNVESEDEIDDN